MIIIIISILTLILNIVGSVVVNTSIGYIEGIDGIDVNTFFGIPFAKPPINELRFASPQPITEQIGNESNPFQANGPFENVSACIQAPFGADFDPNVVSEDCLFLNIFTPSDAEYLKTNYTVMIWIYGGGYALGYIAQFDATNFVEFIGDIIIVTINYRLGVLGFLYDNMFNTGIVGNYGYEDQKLGIKWVYDNIEYFGGNPNNINIFGHSAGGGSVSLHLLYNNEYIKSGIMQSPGQIGFVAPCKTPSTWNDTISQFNKLTNCTDYESDNNQLLNCWRDLNTNTILLAQSSFKMFNFFAPTVETSELLYQPLWGFTNGKINNIPPYIIGTNKDETVGFGFQFQTYQEALETIADDIVEGDLEICEAIFDHYGINETNFIIGKDYGYIGSNFWRCSVRYQLELLGDNTDNIYIYDFDIVNYETNKFFQPSCWNNTCHGAEMVYFWWYGIEYDNKTIEIGEDMKILWSNFAKTLNPNDDGYIIWPSYTNTEGINNYLDMEGYNEFNDKSTYNDDYTDICSFWNKVGYAGNYSNPNPMTTTTLMPMSSTIDDESKYETVFVHSLFVSLFCFMLCSF